MNLFFTAVTNKLHHKTLVELVNSTPKIEKIFLIYHCDFEFIFNRKIDVKKIKYSEAILGNYSGYEKNFNLNEKEYDFLKTFTIDLFYMMNRLHRIYSYSFSDRYQMLIDHYKGVVGIFNSFKPDICFFTNIPHEVFDFVFYKIAEHREIDRKYLMHGMQLEAHYQILDKIEGNDHNLLNYENSSNILSKDLDVIFQKYTNPNYQHFYMEKGYAPSYRKHKFLSINNFLIHYRFLKSIIRQKLFFKYLLQNVIFKYFETIVSKLYLKNKLFSKFDLNTKYIYVPLNYQPEQTTSPQGGIFFDQINMVELLDRNCPKGYKIYVKDHPKQKINFGRDLNFFKRINKLENVVFIDKKIESKILFKHTDIIATVTGSVGFEALCNNKNVLVFGEPFYMHYKAATKIRNDYDLIKFFERFESNQSNNDLTNLFKFLNNCEKNFHYGFMDMEYAHFSRLSLDENIKQLVINIKNSFKI